MALGKENRRLIYCIKERASRIIEEYEEAIDAAKSADDKKKAINKFIQDCGLEIDKALSKKGEIVVDITKGECQVDLRELMQDRCTRLNDEDIDALLEELK